MFERLMIAFKLKWRWQHAAYRKALWRYISRETDDSDVILFQIYWSV